MNKLRTLTLAALAAMFLGSGFGYAAEPVDQHKDGAKWSEKMEAKKEEFFKELGLNEDQKKALKDNKEKNRAEKKELFESMRDKMKLMQEELGRENLDMGKINQIHADLKAIQGKMADQRLEHILEVRKILTPEQFRKFSEKMNDRKHHGGHDWGKKDRDDKTGDDEQDEHPDHPPEEPRD